MILARNATSTPITNDPKNIIIKNPVADAKVFILAPYSANVIIVLYNTIVTASLKIDSPNTRLNKRLSVPISFIIANTDTGSVAEISAPKAKLSDRESPGTLAKIPPIA